MKFVRLFVACALVAPLAGCIAGGETEEPGGADIRVGDALPQFALTLDNGTQITTQSLAGSVALILFFNTDCPDCQAQLPAVEQIYEIYRANPEVMIFAVSREEGGADVSDYWNKNHLTLPYSAQESRSIYSLFAAETIPRIYIADKNGIVQYISTDNPESTCADLQTAIDTLLQQ